MSTTKKPNKFKRNYTKASSTLPSSRRSDYRFDSSTKNLIIDDTIKPNQYIQFKILLFTKHGDLFGSLRQEFENGQGNEIRYPATPTPGTDAYKAFMDGSLGYIWRIQCKEALILKTKQEEESIKIYNKLIGTMTPEFHAKTKSHPLYEYVNKRELPSKELQETHRCILKEDIKVKDAERGWVNGELVKTSATEFKNIHLFLLIIRSIILKLDGDSTISIITQAYDGLFQEPDLEDQSTIIDFSTFVLIYKEHISLLSSFGINHTDEEIKSHFLTRVSRTRHATAINALKAAGDISFEECVQYIQQHVSGEDSVMAARSAAGLATTATASKLQYAAFATTGKSESHRNKSQSLPSKNCFCGKRHWYSECDKGYDNPKNRPKIDNEGKPYYKCDICGKNHMTKNHAKHAGGSTSGTSTEKNKDTDATSTKEEQLMKLVMALSLLPDDVDEKESMIQHAVKLSEKVSKNLKITKNIHMMSTSENEEYNSIRLDDNAETHGFCNQNFLSNIISCGQTIVLVGAVGSSSGKAPSTAATKCGTLVGEKVPVFPNATANILAAGVLRKHGWSTIYNDTKGTKSLTSPCGKHKIEARYNRDQVMVITSIDGVNVSNMLNRQDNQQSRLVSMLMGKNNSISEQQSRLVDMLMGRKNSISLPQTNTTISKVEDNSLNDSETRNKRLCQLLMGKSKVDISPDNKCKCEESKTSTEDSETTTVTALSNKLSSNKYDRKSTEAAQLYKLFPINPCLFKQMFENGNIINTRTGLTGQDIQAIFQQLDADGFNAASASRSKPIKQSLSSLVLQPGDSVHADIFIDENRSTGVIYVDRKTNFAVYIDLDNDVKSATNIKKTFDHAKAIYKSYGYDIKRLTPDNENNFAATKLHVLQSGTKFGQTPSGEADKISEQATKIIKVIIDTLRRMCIYELPDKANRFAIYEAVRLYNITPTYNKVHTPSELFCNEKINVNEILTQPFGTLALMHQETSLRTPEHPERAEYGILLGPDKNHKGCYNTYLVTRGRTLPRRTISKLLTKLPDTMLFKPNPRTATKEQLKEYERLISSYSNTLINNRYAVLSDDDDSDNDDDSESDEGESNYESDEDNLSISSESTSDSNSNSSLPSSKPKTTPKPKSQPKPAKPPAAQAHEGAAGIRSSYGRPLRPSQFANYTTWTYKPRGTRLDPTGNQSFPFDPGIKTFKAFLNSIDNSILDHEIPIVNIYRTYVKSDDIDRNSPKYKAIFKELLQMFTRKVFHTIKYKDIPPEYRSKIIGSLMFLKDKYTADGTFDKTKARLAARGDQETTNIFNAESSSPTANIISIFIAISIAVQHQAKVRISDVPGAFLNAKLADDNHIYMRLPKECINIWCEITGQQVEEVIHKDGNIYVKLDMALYGLVEASALWYKTLSRYLVSIGYECTGSDKCVFIKRQDDQFCIVLIHVDDLLQVSNSTDMLEELNIKLEQQYGELSKQIGNKLSFLNMNIIIDEENETISIDQTNYIQNILKQYNITEESTYPSSENLFKEDDNSPPCDKKSYLSLLMALMYVANHTRFDIAKEVIFLSTKVVKPTISDWNKLLKVLHYLNKSQHRPIIFRKSYYQLLEIFADASFNVHANTAGHTGIFIRLFGNPILCKSLKQRLVTKSSTESELVSLDEAITYVPWILQLLFELGFPLNFPVKVYQDNKSTIEWSIKGRINFKRTKHILNRYFFVKQYVDNKTVEIIYIPTHRMLADLFTKSLIGALFFSFVATIFNEIL